jgi:hypothetical protein
MRGDWEGQGSSNLVNVDDADSVLETKCCFGEYLYMVLQDCRVVIGLKISLWLSILGPTWGRFGDYFIYVFANSRKLCRVNHRWTSESSSSPPGQVVWLQNFFASCNIVCRQKFQTIRTHHHRPLSFQRKIINPPSAGKKKKG